MPAALGAIISNRLATFVELQRDLSTEDAYDLLEIIIVDRCNERP